MIKELEEIRNKEIENRKVGIKSNINTPEMQDMRWMSYGKGRIGNISCMQEMYDYVISRIHGGNVLDIGCGEAGIIWKLANLKICSGIVGVDISKLRIGWNEEIVEEKYKDCRIIFKLCGAENILLSDEIFDYAICTATLEHVTNVKKSLSEILRVLKIGGKAILGIPIEERDDQPLKSPDHYHFWKSKESIMNLFKNMKITDRKLIKPNYMIEIEK